MKIFSSEPTEDASCHQNSLWSFEEYQLLNDNMKHGAFQTGLQALSSQT